MATGGRVLHHIRAFGPDARNLLLFVGHQAAGTRGASIVGGEPRVKLLGELVPIRAEVVHLRGLSAHADRDEIVAWLRGFTAPPKHTFVTHGDPEAAAALAEKIRCDLGWSAGVPAHLDEATLS
jgi:metallo-beta-lactamase family protein